MAKYIHHKELGFIIFGNNVRHDLIARYLGGAEKVISAGIYHCFPENGQISAGSTTLNLPLVEEDKVEIEELFY
jgi:hypothetical protein